MKQVKIEIWEALIKLVVHFEAVAIATVSEVKLTPTGANDFFIKMVFDGQEYCVALASELLQSTTQNPSSEEVAEFLRLVEFWNAEEPGRRDAEYFCKLWSDEFEDVCPNEHG